MKMLYEQKFKLGIAVAVLSGLSLNSYAQLAGNLTIGNPKAMAMANAITADSSGIDAVHYNPAALTKLKGRQVAVKIVVGMMDIKSKFTAPSDYADNFSGDDSDTVQNRTSRTKTGAMYLPAMGGMTKVPVLVAPLSGVSINNPGSKFTFATNFYTPQALGYSRMGKNDPGRYNGREVTLQRLTYFSPTIAYEMNDHWSFGGSVGFSHQAMGLNLDMRAPGTLTGLGGQAQNLLCDSDNALGQQLKPFFDICGGKIGAFEDIANMRLDFQQSLSPSFNLGTLWEPKDWFAWGLSYQSESRMQARGKYNIKYSKDWQNFWQGLNDSFAGKILSQITPGAESRTEKGRATIHLVNPDVLSTGIKIKPFDKWQFNFDVRWADYSDFKGLKVEFDKDIDFLTVSSVIDPKNAKPKELYMDRNYHDTISWSLGTQYDLSSRIQLRAGYEWRPSAISKKNADVLIPIGHAHLYGLGMGYRWDKETQIDVGFNYLVSSTYIPANKSCNVNCTDIDNIVYNPYAGLNIRNTVKAYVFSLNYQTKF